MAEILIKEINTDKFNPFGASEEELVANALDEAGLIKATTIINDKIAREFCNSFFDKRDNYKESTKLGNLLIKNALITGDQLYEALEYQKSHPGVRLGDALVALCICTLQGIEESLTTQNLIREDIKQLDTFKDKIADIKKRLGKYF